MSKRHRSLHYRQFADDIDIDAFEEAIGFEPLESKDGEDIGYCPDLWGMHKHGDTSGKFAISREKKVYHCWVCGGGTLLSLAMESWDLDEESAIERLSTFAKAQPTNKTQVVDDIMELLSTHQAVMADREPHFNERVLSQFDSEDKDALWEWCRSRCITYAAADKFRLGYAPMHKKAAPIRGGERIDEPYFGPVLVFPHFWEGRLVGWQHRWLADDTPKWLPKYTNTTDFPKSTTLYNYDRVVGITSEPIIVCESVPTVLFLASHGYPAVATFGSSVQESQLRLLRRFRSHGVVLAPDNDEPGQKFARGARKYLERFIPVSTLPPVEKGEGADLGDFASSKDPARALAKHLERRRVDDIPTLS